MISLLPPYTHKGSLENLLGKDPDPKLQESLSNELQVTKDTPPTFLFHTADDSGVAVQNSTLFFAALRKAGVPAEMHIYAKGPHGVGLAPKDPALSTWPALCAAWMQGLGVLQRK